MFNTLIASGVVFLQLGIVFLVVAILTDSPVLPRIAPWTTIGLRVLFVGGAFISLVYEYIFLYAPCMLCWYQRIAIFGIAILALTGNVQKSALLRKQISIFAWGGLLFALFHNIIDIFPTGVDVCGATGPSCLARYIYEFGYITIPMMALTVLSLGLLLVYIAKRFPHTTLAE